MIVVFGVIIDHIYHTDRLINARAVDVFAQEEVIVVVFSDNVTAVIAVFSQMVRYIAAYSQVLVGFSKTKAFGIVHAGETIPKLVPAKAGTVLKAATRRVRIDEN